jgi:hypothetical protein
MSIDVLITLGIGLVAVIYVARIARQSAKRMLAPRPGQSACGGCSGCGTPEGHADSADSCSVGPAAPEKLVELGRKTNAIKSPVSALPVEPRM